MTSLEDGHDHPQFGVWEYRPTSFYKSVLYLRHCSSKSSHSAQGRVLPQLPWGARMNLWPPSRSCIIPAVATEPTLNTQNTQFPPDGPNCQPSMGIWEPLANQLEHSYEIWCKTYTITAAVCKYLPFHQYSDTHIHVQGGIEPSPFSGKVCRDVWLSSFANFPLGLFLLWSSHHRPRRSILQEWTCIGDPRSSSMPRVSKVNKMHGLSAGGVWPAMTFEQSLEHSSITAMGCCLHLCSLSKLLLTTE